MEDDKRERKPRDKKFRPLYRFQGEPFDPSLYFEDQYWEKDIPFDEIEDYRIFKFNGREIYEYKYGGEDEFILSHEHPFLFAAEEEREYHWREEEEHDEETIERGGKEKADESAHNSGAQRQRKGKRKGGIAEEIGLDHASSDFNEVVGVFGKKRSVRSELEKEVKMRNNENSGENSVSPSDSFPDTEKAPESSENIDEN